MYMLAGLGYHCAVLSWNVIMVKKQLCMVSLDETKEIVVSIGEYNSI